MDQNNSNSSLKQLVLQCEMHLQADDFDRALKCLEDINKLDLSKESKEDIKASIDILEYVIKIAQEKRLNLAGVIANFNRFKDYLNF